MEVVAAVRLGGIFLFGVVVGTTLGTMAPKAGASLRKVGFGIRGCSGGAAPRAELNTKQQLGVRRQRYLKRTRPEAGELLHVCSSRSRRGESRLYSSLTGSQLIR
jgi:hypothetical protein